MSTQDYKMICPQTFWRVSIKGLIFNDKHQLLMTQDNTGAWTVPGGGMDHGEDPIQTLKREFKEELGLGIQSVDERPVLVIPCLDLDFHKGPTPRLVIIYVTVVSGEITHYADDVASAKWVDLDRLMSVAWSESIVDSPVNKDELIDAIKQAEPKTDKSVIQFSLEK